MKYSTKKDTRIYSTSSPMIVTQVRYIYFINIIKV